MIDYQLYCQIKAGRDADQLTAFELLRYALGGDRPSQTAYHALSPIQIMDLG